MLRCWTRSEAEGPEEPRRTACGAPLSPRVLWLALVVLLLLVVVALGVSTHLGLQHRAQELRFPQHSALISQSALVDRINGVVTYSVTSQTNHSSTVVFDTRRGLVCYKPEGQDGCFLRHMERLDYENVDPQLNDTEPQVRRVWALGNQTEKHTEFLGVMSGSRVDASGLQEPLRSLCQRDSVYWTRRVDGPGKQRLIYFCIDICFPSNICVSVCFYYLPE